MNMVGANVIPLFCSLGLARAALCWHFVVFLTGEWRQKGFWQAGARVSCCSVVFWQGTYTRTILTSLRWNFDFVEFLSTNRLIWPILSVLKWKRPNYMYKKRHMKIPYFGLHLVPVGVTTKHTWVGGAPCLQTSNWRVYLFTPLGRVQVLCLCSVVAGSTTFPCRLV